MAAWATHGISQPSATTAMPRSWRSTKERVRFSESLSPSTYLATLRAASEVPLHRSRQAFVKGRLSLKAEPIERPAGVEVTARLPVGLGGVPRHVASKIHQLGDAFGELTNGNLNAGTD